VQLDQAQLLLTAERLLQQSLIFQFLKAIQVQLARLVLMALMALMARVLLLAARQAKHL
jgi:hypothetical protein